MTLAATTAGALTQTLAPRPKPLQQMTPREGDRPCEEAVEHVAKVGAMTSPIPSGTRRFGHAEKAELDEPLMLL